MNPEESLPPLSLGTTVGFCVYSMCHPAQDMLSALHNAWSPIVAAIFAGNAIVLKCSEHVVWSTNWFVGAIHQCLRACGYKSSIQELVQVRIMSLPIAASCL